MRLFISILLGMICLSAVADGIQSDAANQELKIVDIRYEYQVFTTEDGKKDCTGVLEVDIKLPPDVTRVLCYRSRPHLTDYSSVRLLLCILSDYPTDEWVDKPVMTISKPDMTWGSCFRFAAIFQDHTRIYSDTIDINNYILKEDLDMIMGRSGIGDITTAPIDVFYENKSLVVDSKENVYVNILDISGKTIYSGQACGRLDIPIPSPQLLIVRCQTNNSTITKKILCK